eukprot:gene7886-9705_t
MNQSPPTQIENVSIFPPPPPFYKLYLNYNPSLISTTTASNVGGINTPPIQSVSSPLPQQHDKTTTATTTTTTTGSVSSASIMLPLPPPIPPKQGSTYQLFGQPYSTVDVLPSLDELGMTQLYPKGDIDPIGELKKLNRSILFNYLQLLETLIDNPTDYKTKTSSS